LQNALDRRRTRRHGWRRHRPGDLLVLLGQQHLGVRKTGPRRVFQRAHGFR